jgi:hypothetical protein
MDVRVYWRTLVGIKPGLSFTGLWVSTAMGAKPSEQQHSAVPSSVLADLPLSTLVLRAFVGGWGRLIAKQISGLTEHQADVTPPSPHIPAANS